MYLNWKSLSVVVCLSLLGCGESASSSSEPLAVVPALLENLNPADRKLVEAQKTCPVSHELLCSRDEPIKTKVGGKVVFVCSPACQDRLKKDSKKFLASMNSTAKR